MRITIYWPKIFVFTTSCLPLLYWLYHLIVNATDIAIWGADPIKTLNHELGKWGLYFLFITLSITPLRQLGKWPVLARFRRMLGLFSLFYITLHLLSYLQFLIFWDFSEWYEDIVERPYITFGMVAWVGLVLLGITSTNGWMKRLKKNWQKLHKIVYGIAILGVVHYFYIQRSDIGEAVLYAIILALLLGYRAFYAIKKRLT